MHPNIQFYVIQAYADQGILSAARRNCYFVRYTKMFDVGPREKVLGVRKP